MEISGFPPQFASKWSILSDGLRAALGVLAVQLDVNTQASMPSEHSLVDLCDSADDTTDEEPEGPVIRIQTFRELERLRWVNVFETSGEPKVRFAHKKMRPFILEILRERALEVRGQYIAAAAY